MNYFVQYDAATNIEYELSMLVGRWWWWWQFIFQASKNWSNVYQATQYMIIPTNMSALQICMVPNKHVGPTNMSALQICMVSNKKYTYPQQKFIILQQKITYPSYKFVLWPPPFYP